MATKEIDLLGEAIAGTEKEIFGSATDGKEEVLDDTGDTTPEAMGEGLEGRVEAQAEAEEGNDAEEAEEADDGDDAGNDGKQQRDKETGQFKAADKDDDAGKPAEKTEPEQPNKPEGRVPPGRLREESQKRQAAEAERDAAKADNAKLREDFQALNRRLDEALQRMAQPQQPPKPAETPKAEERPDMFLDPEGYARWVDKQAEQRVLGVEQKLSQRFVEASLAAAHDVHGDKFTAAYSALTGLDSRDPAARVTVQKIWSAPNPGKALMDWHRERETIRMVGNDPTAYEQRIREETKAALLKDPDFRKTLIDELKAEAAGGANNGQPRNLTRLPPSLNGARGGQGQRPSPRATDNSDAAVFESAFETT